MVTFSRNVMLSERSLRKLNRRNIRVSAIVLGNTTTWDSFTFDSISYVSNIDLLTIEFLNSQAVSLCVSEKYGKGGAYLIIKIAL